jgi:magnesium transporter
MNPEIYTHLHAGDYHRAHALLAHGVPAETARNLAKLDLNDRWEIFQLIESKEALAVFLNMDDEEQANLLETMGLDEARKIASHLPIYTLARTHELLPRDCGDAILDSLPHARRDAVLAILRHPVDSVARVMRTDFEAVEGGTSVADALQRLRASSALSDDVVSLLFVTDAEGHYLGYVRLSTLVRAEPGAVVGGIVESRNNRIAPTDDKVDAARRLQRTNLPVLPVVDTANRLVGVIRFDDAMDVLEEDTSEDVYKKAGIGDLVHNTEVVRSEKLTSGGIGYPVKVRLLFLMVTLAGGLAVGGLIDHFEEVLMAVVALAIFIPLVMDMGGNVGTQSTTIFARGLALGHINLQRFFRVHLLREMAVGLAMGVVIGVVAGTIAYFWQGAPNDLPMLGVVVGVALFFSVMTASILGFLLPWVMLKIGVDHAPGADPFITTIKDFSGLAVYFLMAVWLLGLTV